MRPNPNKNVFNDEFNGDVSTMGAQGTVTYTYESQLPFANIPPTCTFTIQGDATGASILTTGYFTDTNSKGQTVAPESQVIAGLQQAVDNGVNVVSESYGYGALPGASDDLLAPTNQAMVRPGSSWWRAPATAVRPEPSRPQPTTPTSSMSAERLT